MLIRSIFNWAERNPHKVAIVQDGQALTYREFAEAIATARGYFHRRGLRGPGTAAIAVRRLLDFWVLSLALRSLGLTTIAVPRAEHLAELNLPDLRLIVTLPEEDWPGLANLASSRALPILAPVLDGEEAPLSLGSDGEPPFGGHILLTSGTTGAFKMLLRDPAIEEQLIARRIAYLKWNQDSVAVAFDFPAWTFAGFGAPTGMWTIGASVVIQQAPPIYRALTYPGLTVGYATPMMLNLLLAAPKEAFPRQEKLLLSVGGGTPSPAQVKEARERITPHIVNILGATEVGTFAYTSMDDPDGYWLHRIVPDAGVEVVDEQDRLVPAGELGNVRVRMSPVASSYLNDPAASAASFRNGFFYTGDVGSIRPDGRLALQGRSTDVLNVNGHKVLPEPIENRLSEALGARVCLAVMKADKGDGLYLVIEGLSPISANRLQAATDRELSGLTLATHVVYINALPRNHMGKVVRREVAAHLAGAAASARP